MSREQMSPKSVDLRGFKPRALTEALFYNECFRKGILWKKIKHQKN